MGLNDIVNVGQVKQVTAGTKIELVSGKSSITLDEDGTITIKGKVLVVEGRDHIGLTSELIELN